MNKSILKGRLTADPEVRYGGQNNTAIAKFSIAVNRRGKDAGSDFIRCVAFGSLAEFADKYLEKGKEILVVGHIQTGSYSDKDGKKVYTTDVVLDEIEFCGSKGDQPSGNTEKKSDGFNFINMDVEMEELPFN